VRFSSGCSPSGKSHRPYPPLRHGPGRCEADVTLKSLFELSLDERAHLKLRLGERLEALNTWRAQIRDRNSFEPEPDEIYDIAFYGFSGIGMRIRRSVLSRAEREAYTAEMRAARCAWPASNAIGRLHGWHWPS
jgi:hypothetical protein